MIRRIFTITRYHWLFVFLLAGACVIVVAYSSYNLLTLSMANLRFLSEHGTEAIRAGALLQLLQLFGIGVAALAAFITYKICESDLLRRYRSWIDDQNGA